MTRATAPSREGEKAGIIAFPNEEYYYPPSVARVSGRSVVQLEKHAGPQTGASGVIVSSVPIDASGPIGLEVQGRGDRYDFLYADGAAGWKALAADQDGRSLSTAVAEGFVRTMLGLYATAAVR